MEITLNLTEAEQALLLANRHNDQPCWSDIARKIEQASAGTQGSATQRYCACCVDNDCECHGTRIRTEYGTDVEGTIYLIGDESSPNYGDIPYDSPEAARESAQEIGGKVWTVHVQVISAEQLPS